MIHYPQQMFVCLLRDIQHVLDPIRPIGHLHIHPIGFAVFHSAVPVNVEAEDVFVETVHWSAVAKDEAGVDEPRWMWKHVFGPTIVTRLLQDADLLSSRIDNLKVTKSRGRRTDLHAFCGQIALKLSCVRHPEDDSV